MLPDGKPAACTGVVSVYMSVSMDVPGKATLGPAAKACKVRDNTCLVSKRLSFPRRMKLIKENSLKFVCPASNQEKRALFNLLL